MDAQTIDLGNRSRSFPSTRVFLVLWLPAGFVLGTLTLLGPVRWWVNACRHFSASQRIESGGVFIMIGMLFMISGYAARLITNIMEASGTVPRIVTAGVVLVVAGSTVAAWMHPALMSGSMAEEQNNSRFTFGPFPDESRMRELRQRGYTIVSLLHPAVVPFEPKLIRDEKQLAHKIGIPLIHVPMLPWISGNADALATMMRLAADPTRHFYVHCYLGQDRVRVVRRALEQAGVGGPVEGDKPLRSIQGKAAFERGRVYRLGWGVYVTGYPTDDEFMRYVLSGEIRQVVAMLDVRDPEDRLYIDRERQLLKQHDLPFELIQAEKDRFDPGRVREVVRRVAKMPKPVLVHEFLSPSSGRSPWTDGFIQTFFSQRPSLPPTLFTVPLRKGLAQVVVAHVAIGPRPSRHDFRELAKRGVVECVHVGSEPVTGDASRAARVGMRWSSATREGIVAAVRDGGPFYVYGSDAGPARSALERAYPKPRPVM